MPTKSLDEIFVGERPPTNSAQLLQLDDGTYEVVLRLMPPEDEWEPGTCPPPDLDIRTYTNVVEAKAWFKQLKHMLQRMGPP